MVRTQVAHRHIAVARRFDGARTEPARFVTIDQLREQHRRRVLLAAAATVIAVKKRRGNLPLGLVDNMHDVTSGHPLARVIRQDHQRLAGGPNR